MKFIQFFRDQFCHYIGDTSGRGVVQYVLMVAMLGVLSIIAYESSGGDISDLFRNSGIFSDQF